MVHELTVVARCGFVLLIVDSATTVFVPVRWVPACTSKWHLVLLSSFIVTLQTGCNSSRFPLYAFYNHWM